MFVHAVCVSKRTRGETDRDWTSDVFIYFFLSSHKRLRVSAAHLYACARVQVFYGHVCVHVCRLVFVMKCLYDKHKASLRRILIRGFATVVMETALSSCVSQWS